MKACVLQPPYSMEPEKSDAYFQKKLDLLASCDPTMDLIVLPEYSDVPCAVGTREENLFYSAKYQPILMAKAAETAVRCGAVLFVNAYDTTPTGIRNTTFAFDQTGAIVGKYYKKHLPPSEQHTLALDSAYTFEPSAPYVLTIDGIRYGFLTCYDFYFYEAFAAIARENVDIIIGCSLQRTDTHEALEIIGRFLSYNTNAYLVRASVAMDNSPTICGASMIVAPTGEVLCNMKGNVGLGTAELDPHQKYYKPAGFGGKPTAHYEYIEWGRHGWQYRPGGSAIVPDDRFLPYPRVCAQNAYRDLPPMAAYGAAVGLGMSELSLTLTMDGDTIYTNGNVPLAQVLQKFSCHTVFALTISPTADAAFAETLHRLLHRYDCMGYCYFVLTTPTDAMTTELPDIPRCLVCENEADLAKAKEIGCDRVWVRDTMLVSAAHRLGLRCYSMGTRAPEADGIVTGDVGSL